MLRLVILYRLDEEEVVTLAWRSTALLGMLNRMVDLDSDEIQSLQLKITALAETAKDKIVENLPDQTLETCLQLLLVMPDFAPLKGASPCTEERK